MPGRHRAIKPPWRRRLLGRRVLVLVAAAVCLMWLPLAATAAPVLTAARADINQFGPYRGGPTPISDLRISGCVLGFSSSDGRPAIHANKSHTCVGVSSVTISTAGDVQVTYERQGPVVTTWVQPDETLVARGVSAGVSGGVTTTHIRLYDAGLARKLNMGNYRDRMRVQGTYSNLWVGAVHNPGRNQ